MNPQSALRLGRLRHGALSLGLSPGPPVIAASTLSLGRCAPCPLYCEFREDGVVVGWGYDNEAARHWAAHKAQSTACSPFWSPDGQDGGTADSVSGEEGGREGGPKAPNSELKADG